MLGAYAGRRLSLLSRADEKGAPEVEVRAVRRGRRPAATDDSDQRMNSERKAVPPAGGEGCVSSFLISVLLRIHPPPPGVKSVSIYCQFSTAHRSGSSCSLRLHSVSIGNFAGHHSNRQLCRTNHALASCHPTARVRKETIGADEPLIEHRIFDRSSHPGTRYFLVAVATDLAQLSSSQLPLVQGSK